MTKIVVEVVVVVAIGGKVSAGAAEPLPPHAAAIDTPINPIASPKIRPRFTLDECNRRERPSATDGARPCLDPAVVGPRRSAVTRVSRTLLDRHVL